MNLPIRAKLIRFAALALALGSSTSAWAKTYYWRTAAGDGEWANYKNWSTESSSGNPGTSKNAYPNELSEDIAVFNDPVTVTLRSSTNGYSDELVNDVVLNADVTLSGGLLQIANPEFGAQSQRETKLILINGVVLRGQKQDVAIKCNIEIPEGETATLKGHTKKKLLLSPEIAITGGGTLVFDPTNDDDAGISLYADCSAFTGVVDWRAKAAKIDSRLYEEAADQRNASWQVYTNNVMPNCYFFGKTGGGKPSVPFRFGALNAHLYSYKTPKEGDKATDISIEIGYRKNEDSFFAGTLEEGSNSLTWLGEQTLTLALTNLTTLAVTNGGTVAFLPTAELPSSITLAGKGGFFTLNSEFNSNLANTIASIDEAATVGFANEEALTLDIASKKAEVFEGKSLSKKGSGALTIRGWSVFGSLSVGGGTLYIPAGSTASGVTLAPDATLAVDGEITPGTTYLTVAGDFGGTAISVQGTEITGTYDSASGKTTWSSPGSGAKEIATDATATIDADSQAAADAAAADYSVILTSGQKTQGLETTYYKVVATHVSDDEYMLSVVLDKESVGVDIGEGGISVSDTAVTFTMQDKVKKGLYYGIEAIANPGTENETKSALAEVKAESDGEAIKISVNLDFGSGNPLLLRWYVSDVPL